MDSEKHAGFDSFVRFASDSGVELSRLLIPVWKKAWHWRAGNAREDGAQKTGVNAEV